MRCVERRALRSLCVSRLKIIKEDQRIGIRLADKTQPVELVPMVAHKWQLVEGSRRLVRSHYRDAPLTRMLDQFCCDIDQDPLVERMLCHNTT
ncbi:hypothetical protein RB4451 [Rhodopirellula baltica SH 1]|uniref:Uncharacterized protein n=1 Tax=Rhodopirellula baltica (strain DSM 10527 / NCIMB 13988 / SH1) TaxID=243090 RepID=Q7USK5_RHOBA|nr:hypothetical protein RB4451 [Rhodopirellula baltica SH 1]